MTEIQRTSREVIEGKLLTALDDEGKAAILVGKDDLDFLIESITQHKYALVEIAHPPADFNQWLVVASGHPSVEEEA